MQTTVPDKWTKIESLETRFFVFFNLLKYILLVLIGVTSVREFQRAF